MFSEEDDVSDKETQNILTELQKIKRARTFRLRPNHLICGTIKNSTKDLG